MFGVKLLRQVSLVTLFFFILFIGTADFSLAQAQEEDILTKARKLYKEGDYEGSIKLLSEFIQKLIAMVEQKKNVAEAFYLLAKIYFEVGDDAKVEENLKKVFETYPTFKKEEPNFSFNERVERARKKYLQEKEKEAREKEKELKAQEEKVAEPQVIEQPTIKKKKKKFPALLVVGGVALVVLLVILLSKKKKSEPAPQPEPYDIRGDWTVTVNFQDQTFPFMMTFSGNLNQGTFSDQDGDTGTYAVNNRAVEFSYDDYDIIFTGSFSTRDRMSGPVAVAGVSGDWSAERGFGNAMTGSVKSIKTKGKN